MKSLPALAAALIFLLAPLAVKAQTPKPPQGLSPAELAGLMATGADGLEVVDVRPASEFADYHLPGAENLDPGTVLSDPGLAFGPGPLVLVDKDGYQAPALAGMLGAKAKRPVKYLRGGLLAWWGQSELSLVRKAAATPGEKP